MRYSCDNHVYAYNPDGNSAPIGKARWGTTLLHEIIICLLGLAIGALMGMTGAGGGILAVPALVYGLGLSMQQASPIALLAVASAASLGAWRAWRENLVRYRAAFLMASAGAIPAGVCVKLAQQLPQRWLMLAFATVLLYVAVRAWQQARMTQEDLNSATCWAQIDQQTGRFHWNWQTATVLAGIGVIAGSLTGLLGVGGGFVMVPMLRRFTNASLRAAIATSLLVVAIVSSIGVGSAVWHGAYLPWLALPFAATMIAGMISAQGVAERLSNRQIQSIFASLLLLVAVSLIIRASF